jgi:hypothetical protein
MVDESDSVASGNRPERPFLDGNVGRVQPSTTIPTRTTQKNEVADKLGVDELDSQAPGKK